MSKDAKNWWKNPPSWHHWVLVAGTIIIAIFAVIGPVSPERFNRLPAVIGSLIRLVLKCRLYIVIGFSGVVAYWMRRRIFRVLILGEEWLYVRPLVFLIRPAVQRIIQPRTAPTVSEDLPGWRIIDNWQVREEQIANWELGPNWIRGKQWGTLLWRERLPSVCTVRFEACLLQNRGGDELDVIVGDSMALYFSGGVRLDYMTNDVGQMGKDIKRDPNKKAVQFDKPQVGKWYAFTVIKTSEKATLTIDAKPVMDITWGPPTPFRERLGFHHWNNEVEFKNVRVDRT